MVVNLQKLITIILIISGITTGIFVFMNELAGEDGYNIDISEDTAYEGVFDKMNETTENLEDHYTKMQNLPQNKAAAFFTGTIEVFSIMVSFLVTPFTLLAGLWNSFATALMLPSWITTMITGMIGILIIFAFGAIILKWRA